MERRPFDREEEWEYLESELKSHYRDWKSLELAELLALAAEVAGIELKTEVVDGSREWFVWAPFERITLGDPGELVTPEEPDFFLWELFDFDPESDDDLEGFIRRWGPMVDAAYGVLRTTTPKEQIAAIYELRAIVRAFLLEAGLVSLEEFAGVYKGAAPFQDGTRSVLRWAAAALTDWLGVYSPKVAAGEAPTRKRAVGNLCALELFNALASGEFAKARKCEWCGRPFIRQRGRNRWQHRTDEAVTYCSAAHASAASSKAWRDRAALKKLVVRTDSSRGRDAQP